jgi:hypothetical protein
MPLVLTSVTALVGCAAGAAPALDQLTAVPTVEPGPVALTVNGAPRTIVRACQQNNQYLEIEDELGWTYALDGLVNASVDSVGGEPAGDVGLAVTDDRGATATTRPAEFGREAGRVVYRASLSRREPALDLSIAVDPTLAGLAPCGE